MLNVQLFMFRLTKCFLYSGAHSGLPAFTYHNVVRALACLIRQLLVAVAEAKETE